MQCPIQEFGKNGEVVVELAFLDGASVRNEVWTILAGRVSKEHDFMDKLGGSVWIGKCD